MFLITFLMIQVMIFRLITRGTIEERMMQMTKKKMVLEHLVVGRLKAQNINQVSFFCLNFPYKCNRIKSVFIVKVTGCTRSS